MRLIDADALHVEEWMESMGNGMYKVVEVVYKSDIENAPTIEAEPVRRGRWIYLYDGNYRCSECGDWWTCEETPRESGMLYCPNCGTRMDVERRTDE